MNISPVNAHRPLIELLGARWTLDAAVKGVAWDVTGTTVAFSLGDGTLALASSVWVGGPSVRSRDGGGVELVPAAEAPRPVSRVSVHPTCLSLGADPRGGFLSGGDDGALVLTGTDGTTETLARFGGGWTDRVAASAGSRACAVNRRVHILGGASGGRDADLELPSSVQALAWDPAGRTLAMAHHDGITLWSAADGTTRVLGRAGTHHSLAWSPCGTYVVSGMRENAVHGWRVADDGEIDCGGYSGQPLSLSFAAAGRYLATSGGARVACWRWDPPGGDPFECGIASSVPVSVVAGHPARPLIAAGYLNGAVLLCQPASDDVLFVRGAAPGPVTALAWSADGAALALGTHDGELAIVTLPEELFRTGDGGGP